MDNHIQLLLAISSNQDIISWIMANAENFRRCRNGLLLEYKPDDRIIFGSIKFGNLEYPL